MKWEKITSPEQLKLKGIKIETVMEKSSVNSIALTDSDGNAIIVQAGSGYSEFKVLIPAAPEKVKRYRVTANVAEIPVSKDFDSEYDAKAKARELSSSAEEGTVKVQEVEVEV
jgi:hypothetical protein